MEEGRVTDRGQDRYKATILFESVIETGGQRHTCTHVKARINSPHGDAEGVAPDITRKHGIRIRASHGKKRSSMRTARAELRRPRQDIHAFHCFFYGRIRGEHLRLDAHLGSHLLNDSSHHVIREFSLSGDMAASPAENPLSAIDQCFQNRIGLFQDQYPVTTGGKLNNTPFQRKHTQNLVERNSVLKGRFRNHIPRQGITHAGGHDAEFPSLPRFHALIEGYLSKAR
ncbi:MAG: hypothetical protein A4E63_00145 [Syntrophorhabdus sp. PtaU1.Bin050]|nr:MAG: hypothetical protein A4E63_00145 [Syntrophorhabdus sp. PtaU1.Bin050]